MPARSTSGIRDVPDSALTSLGIHGGRQQNPLLVPVPQGMGADAASLSESADREIHAISLNLWATRRSRCSTAAFAGALAWDMTSPVFLVKAGLSRRVCPV